jgi:hypothetical protein
VDPASRRSVTTVMDDLDAGENDNDPTDEFGRRLSSAPSALSDQGDRIDGPPLRRAFPVLLPIVIPFCFVFAPCVRVVASAGGPTRPGWRAKNGTKFGEISEFGAGAPHHSEGKINHPFSRSRPTIASGHLAIVTRPAPARQSTPRLGSSSHEIDA